MTDLLQVTYHAQTTDRTVRAYGERPARTTATTDYSLWVKVKTKPLAQAIQLPLGYQRPFKTHFIQRNRR